QGPTGAPNFGLGVGHSRRSRASHAPPPSSAKRPRFAIKERRVVTRPQGGPYGPPAPEPTDASGPRLPPAVDELALALAPIAQGLGGWVEDRRTVGLAGEAAVKEARGAVG